MQQMKRQAFIVRVVWCRVHKACIIYVQVVINIFVKIKKKGSTTFKASTNWRRFQTIGGQETQKQNARRLKHTQHLWQNFPPITTPHKHHAIKATFSATNVPPRPNMASYLTYDSKHHQLQTPYHHRNQLNR